MWTNRTRWIVLLAGIVALVLLALPAQLDPSSFLPDDTYFYLQVAYNIVNGHGSTFNGIMPTNGYHPLWMLFCVGGMVLAGGDKAIALHIILLLQVLLFLGVVSYFIRIARLAGIRSWPVALPILALYFLTGLYGSEAHVNALASLAGLYYLLLAADSGRPRDWVLSGLCIGLAVLARLDNVFLPATVILFGILGAPREYRRASGRNLALFLLPFVVVVAPYLIYNAIAFGHLMPISGAIKTSFPRIGFSFSRLALLGEAVTAIAVVGLGLSLRRSLGWHARVLLRVLGVAVLLQSAYIALYLEFGAGWSWYYVLGVINAACVAAIIADGIAARVGSRNPAVARRLAGAAIALLLVAGIARSWYKRYDPYFTQKDTLFRSSDGNHDMRRDLGIWLKDNLPRGSALMVEDGAGTLAYYSDLTVLPIDGLIADYTYNDELLRLGADAYLALHKVNYYVGSIDPLRGDPQRGEPQRVNVIAPLYRKSAGMLSLPASNILLTLREAPGGREVAVWKIR